MQPSIVQAQPIILDGGTTPGCLPPARGAARERIINTAPEALLARATVSNGGHCTSTVVQMATPEHRRGRSDPVGWRDRPGLGVNGPRGRPRSLRRRAIFRLSRPPPGA